MKSCARMKRLVFLVIALSPLSLPVSAAPESLQPMAWPLQPQESVRDLSRLIYPKSARMQLYFIAETIRLNRDTRPDLHPTTVFSTEQEIIIPSIQKLSSKSRVEAKLNAQ